MPTLPNTEALARAVVKETPPAAGALTPAQQEAADITKRRSEKGAHSALESLAARRPIDKKQGDRLFESNFGTERDPSGKKVRAPGSIEEARFNETIKARDLLTRFIEGGTLSVADRGILRSQLEGVLRGWAPADSLFNIAGYNKDAALDRLLEDPKLAGEVKRMLTEKLSASPLEDKVTQKQRELDDLKVQETDKATFLSNVSIEYTNVSNDLSQFEVTGGVVGAKLAELTKLQKDFPRIMANLEERRDELESAKEGLSSLKMRRDILLYQGQDTTTIDGIITQKEADLRRVNVQVTRLTNQVARKQELEAEKSSLEQKKKELQEKKDGLNKEKTDLERKRIATEADLALEKINRNDQEEQFADSIKSIFSEASLKYIQDEIGEFERIDNEKLTEDAAKATDPAEKALIEQMKDRRWLKDKRVGVGPFGRRMIKAANKVALQDDFEHLISGNGDPKAIIRQALVAGGITAAEANAKINNPAFMDKMASQFVEELLSRAIRAGVKFTDADAEVILSSKWGAEMIDKAVSNRDLMDAAKAKLKDKGILENGVAQWFKRKGGGFLLKLLFVLFGSSFLASAGGVLTRP